MTDIALLKLGESFKKTLPACACCGYDADWHFRLETLERMFCDRCMVNVAFDVINFNSEAFA